MKGWEKMTKVATTDCPPQPRGSYIPAALTQYCMNGDAYIPATDAYQICCGGRRVGYSAFQDDLREQLRLKKLSREGNRLYLSRTLRYENDASERLALLLAGQTAVKDAAVPDEIRVGNVALNEEQRESVKLALSHRLSIILGGAGSGKTTLIQAIANCMGKGNNRVLAAPTGKAARNLTERTGMIARTVHSALGFLPDEDFLSPVIWPTVELVIVDEASMMSLEMLAGFLCKMNPTCHLVLVGDPNQLLSVGSGNVLPDLLRLGFPVCTLTCNHRQSESGHGLRHNVVEFAQCHSLNDLTFDESFTLREMDEAQIREQLVQEAVQRYRQGENVQVLSPYNHATVLSVNQLNRDIQKLVNPSSPEKAELFNGVQCFRHGDRVMLTKNDKERQCVNGDVGILRILDDNEKKPVYCVILPDGRIPAWNDYGGLQNMSLAYAITIHKAQGNEYDTILLPVSDGFAGMLHRNLFYTAISRAKRQVILYGSANAIGVSLQRSADPRRSMLVAKTHMAMQQAG